MHALQLDKIVIATPGHLATVTYFPQELFMYTMETSKLAS